MSDAASDHTQVGIKFTEERWRKGIIVLQILHEVLRVIFSGELGRLDEFKREMWLLLVAAGSGYLARCWHKTLKSKPQLTDYAHEDPTDRDGREASNSTPRVLDDTAQNSSRRNSPSSVGNGLAPKPLKRNFSPKTLGKKLFSDVGRSGKTSKKEGEANTSADETNRLVPPGVQKSLDATGGQGKKSPWSGFKSKSKESSSEESSREASSYLKRTTDALRKSRDRRMSDTGSSSSRSLQALLDDAGDSSASDGPSKREVDAPELVYSSTELPAKSASQVLIAGIDESKEASQPRKVAQVVCDPLRPNEADAEVESTLPSLSETSSKNDEDGSAKCLLSHKDSSNLRNNVAEKVARIENGSTSLKVETANAVLSPSAASQSQAEAQASPMDRKKVRTLQRENTDQTPLEGLTGGRGKRRADLGKVAEEVDGKVLPAFLTGKRSKDVKDSANNPTSRESSEVTITSITSKRIKDVTKLKDSGDADEPLTSYEFGDVDLSQVFFGFDSTFLGSPQEEKSPYKNSKRSRYTSMSNRGAFRKMRESPKPVSALESCLRAQFAFKNEGYRVARSLNFSTLISSGGQRRESPEAGDERAFLKDDLFSPSSFARKRGPGGSEQDSPQTEGALGLPLLKTPPRKGSTQRQFGEIYTRGGQQPGDTSSKYRRKVVLEDKGVVSSRTKLNDILWRTTIVPVVPKKRKVTQACSPSATITDMNMKGYELEALVIPPMEGLLFSFGVGIGVMSLMNGSDSEAERLSKELHNSEEKIEKLNNLLRQERESSLHASESLSKQVVVGSSVDEKGVVREVDDNNEPRSNLLALGPTVDETLRKRFDIYRREAPETPQQLEHMAELEAELQAELDALTSGISENTSHPPDLEELDPEGVAGVADRDLGVDGLPALLDWDDDNDDFITEEATISGGGVPPRELARLLRKVQTSRQENRISELEADLQETVEKLHMMEMELELLREQMSFTSLSSDFAAKCSKSFAKDIPGDLLSRDNRSKNDQNEQPSQPLVKDLECHGDDSDSGFQKNDLMAVSIQQAKISNDEPTLCVPLRQQNGSSLRGSVASLMLSEESMESETQADNDAVCDEFLNSVFGSPEVTQNEEETLIASSLVSTVQVPPPVEALCTTDGNKTSAITNDLKDVPPLTSSAEDLDQVVGELLKRDSSSVKNAINAFLLWEAETDGVPCKDDTVEEESSQLQSRRTAGKNATPQKTSIISTRLEQLARSAYTSEKIPVMEKLVGVSKCQVATVDDRSRKLADKGLEMSQPHISVLEEKSGKLLGLWEQSLAKKELSSQTLRREAVKSEASTTENSRDVFWSESPVFGGVGKEYQALFDTRRDLRYSSAKVQLSLAGPPQERDPLPVYRHREDASRAGTNSPIGRLSTKTLFQSPKPKNTRMSLENRLYQNPTSDWLAEVGSPPDT